MYAAPTHRPNAVTGPKRCHKADGHGGVKTPPYHARYTPYNPATGDKRNVSQAACMPPLRIDQTRSRAQNVAIRQTVTAGSRPRPTMQNTHHGNPATGNARTVSRPATAHPARQNGPYLRMLHNGRPVRLVQNGRLRQKCRATLDGRGSPGVYWAHGKGAGEFSLRRFRLPLGAHPEPLAKGRVLPCKQGPPLFLSPCRPRKPCPAAEKQT